MLVGRNSELQSLIICVQYMSWLLLFLNLYISKPYCCGFLCDISVVCDSIIEDVRESIDIFKLEPSKSCISTVILFHFYHLEIHMVFCTAVYAQVSHASFVLALPTARFVLDKRDEPEEDDGEHDFQDDLPVLLQALGQLPRRMPVSSLCRRTAAPDGAGGLFLQRILVGLHRVLLAATNIGGGAGVGHLDVEDALVELDLDRGRVAAAGEVEPLEEVAPLPAAVDGALAADLDAPRRVHLDLQLVLGESCITCTGTCAICQFNISTSEK